VTTTPPLHDGRVFQTHKDTKVFTYLFIKKINRPKPLFIFLSTQTMNTKSIIHNSTARQGDQIGRNSPTGRLFTLGSFKKITELAQILGLLFPSEPCTYECMYICIYFVKKCVELHFGRLFHRLIWSPCFC
jgi:hypothetical protein